MTTEQHQMKPAPSGEPTPASSFGSTAPAPIASDDFQRNVWAVLGVPIDAATVDSAVGRIDAAVASRRPLSFVTPNVNWLVRACREDAARAQIVDADLSLADGAPLAGMARLLGVPIRSRVAGSDVFEALRRRPGFVGRKVSVFFFGGREGSAEAAAAALDAEASGMVAAGWLNPGFGDVEDMSAAEVIDKINAANADFVVVALGAAKGQAWIDRNRDRLRAPVIAHLGAVVDFTSGMIKRAPEIVRKAGLEWAWRIKEEPALWRRYGGDGIALAVLTVARLAPLMAAMRLQKPKGAPTADVVESRSRTHIALGGDHTRDNLSAARDAFRRAAGGRTDIAVDFAAAGRIDMAFLGLLLMLEKHAARAGRRLFVINANRVHNRILAANGVNARSNGPERDSFEGEDRLAATG